MDGLLLLIPALLLAGCAANGALAVAAARGRRPREGLVSALGVAGPAAAFLCTLRLFAGLEDAGGRVAATAFNWFSAGGVDVAFRLEADPLTVVMLLVITGVGTLIHFYSIGYMRGDSGYARYFSFLNLFTAFMSILVLAGDLVVLFVGWEGVGLCSYLLIGFWWSQEGRAAAGLKAFVVNRVGDAAFLLGMVLLWSTCGTLDLDGVRDWFADPANREAAQASTGFLGAGTATLVALLLFIGATGKSAQIPLYVWLPDAMAGPTPVSALIHAATMVTAGVYLVARLGFLYALSPAAQVVIMLVGGATCLLAGVLAMVQFDIKKVLAYSTISQLGYMFIGVGTGFVSAGIFHLVTHAFFKAALFLGAGSIITMTHHEQDMRRMGGLGRRMPWTCAVMVISAAAMAGIPPLSGFFSKDEILWRVFASGGLAGRFAWAMGLVTAALTGFYMFRLIFMTFTGSHRGSHPPQEAPPVMVGPKALLAVGAVLAGFLGVPHVLGGHNGFAAWLAPVLPEYARPDTAPRTGEAVVESSLMLLSVLVGVAGICAAWWAYVRRPGTPGRTTAQIPRAYALARDGFRVDAGYRRWVVDPIRRGAEEVLHRRLDQGLIDGTVNGLARAFRTMAGWLSSAQRGVVRGYVALMVTGTLLLLLLTMLG